MTQVKDIVDKVLNPSSGKTLGEEGRVICVEKKEEDLYITYKRDGISVDVKKSIENLIIDALKNQFSEDNIFVITKSENSQDIYKSTGDRETPKAKNPAELRVGHAAVSEKKSIPGVKNVITIGSGKGGVGKSTVTANLAVTLARQGYKVGIIDADIYGPSMPMLFNRRNEKPEANADKKIVPLENHGIKFISFGNFIHEDEPVVWRGPMLGGVLNQFFFETDWGELDYLLLDLPPGTGDVQLSIIQSIHVDGSVIVSTPQDVALLDARKALHMFDKLNVHSIGMIENMSSFICDSCGQEHFIYGTNGVLAATSELGVGFLGSIPLELGLRKGSDFGTPYMQQDKYKDSKVYDAYTSIAKKLNDYFHPEETKKKSLLSKILKK